MQLFGATRLCTTIAGSSKTMSSGKTLQYLPRWSLLTHQTLQTWLRSFKAPSPLNRTGFSGTRATGSYLSHVVVGLLLLTLSAVSLGHYLANCSDLLPCAAACSKLFLAQLLHLMIQESYGRLSSMLMLHLDFRTCVSDGGLLSQKNVSATCSVQVSMYGLNFFRLAPYGRQ